MSSQSRQASEKRCKTCHKQIKAGELVWSSYPPQEYQHSECFKGGMNLSLKLLQILGQRYIRVFANPVKVILVKWHYDEGLTICHVTEHKGFQSNQVTEDWLIDYVIKEQLWELKYS